MKRTKVILYRARERGVRGRRRNTESSDVLKMIELRKSVFSS